MVWLKKILASILGMVLLAALVATAVSYGANLIFANPQKLDNWLGQNSVYQNFVNNAVSQSEKSLGLEQNQVGMTLGSTVVRQAAESSFSKQSFNQNVDTFISSNYKWLEGKTNQPNYAINLSGPKQNFANQISTYSQQFIAKLPTCTPQQLADINDSGGFDALSANCRPASLSTQAIADTVTQKIDSSGFLKNPILTANNVGLTGSNDGQPYYQRLPQAPKIFKYVVQMPWLYAAVALVSSALLIWLMPDLRKSLGRIGIILAEAGSILIIFSLIANGLTKILDKHFVNSLDSSQLQASITRLFSQIEHDFTNAVLWFGIIYLVLALILILLSRFGSRPAHKNKRPIFQPIPTVNKLAIVGRFNDTPNMGLEIALQTPQPTKKKRPPRLIQ